MDIYFKTADDGVAMVDEGSGNGGIYQTNNGGQSWTKISVPGDQYLSMEPYDFTNHKLTACGKKALIGRIVNSGSLFNIVKLDSPESTLNDLYASSAVIDDTHNNVPQLVCGGSSMNLYYTPNATGPHVTWYKLTNATSDPITKILIRNEEAGAGVHDLFYGLLLTNQNSAYEIQKTNNSTAISVSNTNTSGTYKNIIMNISPYEMYLLNLSDEIKKATFNSVSNYAVNINNTAVATATPSPASIAASANFLFAVSSSIKKYAGSWSDYTDHIVPSRINDIAFPTNYSPVAVGIAGSIWASTGTTYALVNQPEKSNLNAVTFAGGFGAVGSDNGTVLKLGVNPITVSNNFSNLAGTSITGVALDNNKLYATLSTGRLMYINDISVVSPISVLSVVGNQVGALNGVSIINNAAFASGDGSSIYSFAGSMGARINELFLPNIKTTHFTDANNGYVIAADGNFRSTMDGGQSWQVIEPQGTHFNDINKIFTLKPGLAMMVGNSMYAAWINGNTISTPISLSGSNNLFNAKFVNDEFGVIVGSASKILEATKSGNTWSFNSYNTPPASVDLQAIHIFTQTSYASSQLTKSYSLIVAGKSKSVFFKLAGNNPFVDESPTTGNPDFNDIYFHDDRTGYVIGTNGVALKCTPTTNIQQLSGSLSWSSLPLINDPFGVYTTSTNLKTLAFADRYRGFFGGYDATPVKKYSMMVNDESNYFSTRFWYDKAGRLILSQNAKQYGTGTPMSFSYTLYDGQGRITESGEKEENSAPKINTIFGSTINGYQNQRAIDPDKYTTWVNGSGTRKEVVRTIYDAQEFNSTIFTQENLRKRVASIIYQPTYNSTLSVYQSASHYSYDIHGNVKDLWQENTEMLTDHQIKHLEYNYDLLSGKVNKVGYQPGEADQFYHKYSYDADNRLREVRTSRDNIFWDLDAKYFYYAHGPLARVEYGDLKVQGLDYAYTLQGWLKGVNSDMLKADFDMGKDGFIPTAGSNPNSFIGRDAMGFTLNYFNGDYEALNSPLNFEARLTGSDIESHRNDLFNGNITSMITNLPENNTITASSSTFNTSPLGYAYKYDQLNRITAAKGYTNMLLNNSGSNNYYYWDNGATNSKYSNTFAYDANGNIMKQERRDENNSVFDSLTYKYSLDGAGNKLQNRLYQVNDLVALTGAKTDDIDNQAGINYNYDAIGNLTSDVQEEIATIEWTVSGKIKMINRSQGSAKADMEFRYDPIGNRIAKIVKPAGSSLNNGGIDDFTQWTTTYYVRDAQGNEMATYEETYSGNIANFYLKEHPMYGSSRVGIDKNEIDLIAVTTPPATGSRLLGNKFYELNNHLGNVLVTVSDKKIPVQAGTSGIVDYYLADVASASDYYPFGSPMGSRSFNGGSYRFGFNGMEKDNEVNGIGNSYSTEFREYDPRLGRWFSIDPKIKPWESPYAAFNNNPIIYSDPRGDDPPPPGDKSKTQDKYNRKFRNFEKKQNKAFGELPIYEQHKQFGESKNILGKRRDETSWFKEYNNSLKTATSTTGWELSQGINNNPVAFNRVLPTITGNGLNAPFLPGAAGYTANQTITQNLGPLGDRRNGVLNVQTDALEQADLITLYVANNDGTRGGILWQNCPTESVGQENTIIPLSKIPSTTNAIIVVISSMQVQQSNYVINLSVTGVLGFGNYPKRKENGLVRKVK